MTSHPWFLQVLGLSPYADRAAVRKAYAMALRQIDPGIDPQGFARLREAYETACLWCEQERTTEAPDDTPRHPPPTERHPDAPQDEDVPTQDDADAVEADPRADARRDAAILMDGFVAGARRGSAVDATDLLDRTVIALRQRYIDAPGELEERLIDLLARQELPHRHALFETASRLFHWEDIGQLGPLGQRGEWVEHVLAQRNVWMRLTESRRKQWLERIGRARRPIDGALVRHWPDMEQLQSQYPHWIGLHMDHDVRLAWKAAFDALPASTQKNHRQSGATAAAFRPVVDKPSARRRVPLRRLGWIVLLYALMQIYRAIADQGSISEWFSLGSRDTPATCAELYRRLSRSDVFAGLSRDEIRELTSRGERCERQGDWHAPTGNGTPAEARP
ncbi:MAG: hypothetical protein GAK28_01297 [Luteibacter sp.]|uniref:hypothetical protein n=1 Tax=Luteibacter sp. TaxID=1886636 RepID=UPI00137D98EC|nr:hypothetical protein [Luteibacter sp.]KAF1008316.1 MAG: hypothetical protein GAK28_01297 [Luteibacter sp.]